VCQLHTLCVKPRLELLHGALVLALESPVRRRLPRRLLHAVTCRRWKLSPQRRHLLLGSLVLQLQLAEPRCQLPGALALYLQLRAQLAHRRLVRERHAHPDHEGVYLSF
jgi:hypothetical protein